MNNISAREFYFALAVQTLCINYDRERGRTIGHSVVADCYGRTLPASRDIAALVAEFVGWQYGDIKDKPKWCK